MLLYALSRRSISSLKSSFSPQLWSSKRQASDSRDDRARNQHHTTEDLQPHVTISNQGPSNGVADEQAGGRGNTQHAAASAEARQVWTQRHHDERHERNEATREEAVDDAEGYDGGGGVGLDG